MFELTKLTAAAAVYSRLALLTFLPVRNDYYGVYDMIGFIVIDNYRDHMCLGDKVQASR